MVPSSPLANKESNRMQPKDSISVTTPLSGTKYSNNIESVTIADSPASSNNDTLERLQTSYSSQRSSTATNIAPTTTSFTRTSRWQTKATTKKQGGNQKHTKQQHNRQQRQRQKETMRSPPDVHCPSLIRTTAKAQHSFAAQTISYGSNPPFHTTQQQSFYSSIINFDCSADENQQQRLKRKRKEETTVDNTVQCSSFSLDFSEKKSHERYRQPQYESCFRVQDPCLPNGQQEQRRLQLLMEGQHQSMEHESPIISISSPLTQPLSPSMASTSSSSIPLPPPLTLSPKVISLSAPPLAPESSEEQEFSPQLPQSPVFRLQSTRRRHRAQEQAQGLEQENEQPPSFLPLLSPCSLPWPSSYPTLSSSLPSQCNLSSSPYSLSHCSSHYNSQSSSAPLLADRALFSLAGSTSPSSPLAPQQTAPIFNLNEDCLTEIFRWCSTVTSLYRLASVCRYWRTVVFQPHLWRTLDYTWDEFVQQMSGKGKNVSGRTFSITMQSSQSTPTYMVKKYPSAFSHVRTIYINGMAMASYLRLRAAPSICPFTQLRVLRLSSVYLEYVMDLAMWIKHIEVLECDNILTFPSNDSVLLTSFHHLHELRILKLQFAAMCELVGPSCLLTPPSDGAVFNLRRRHLTNEEMRGDSHPHSRSRLPSALRVLEISNTYDTEEVLVSGRSVRIASQRLRTMSRLTQRWNEMEEALVNKYKVLNGLTHLTELTLGLCTSFTARVWKECITPCTKHLTRLTLTGWQGDGSRERPSAWLQRQTLADQTCLPVEYYMEEVEIALAEMISGLHAIQALCLFQFFCGPGLMQGLQQLAAHKQKTPTVHSRLKSNEGSTSPPAQAISIPEASYALDDLRNSFWKVLAIEF